MQWNELEKSGNPTHSDEVNNLISVVMKKEVRKQGKPTQADRSFKKPEFDQAMEILSSFLNFDHKCYYTAMGKFQFHFIARLDNTCQVKKDTLGPCCQFPFALMVVTVGNLGTYSFKKAWWKWKKCQQDVYADAMLPWPDVKVVPKLCIGGLCKYALKEKVGISNSWLLENAMPGIAMYDDEQVAAVCPDISSRIKAAYNRLSSCCCFQMRENLVKMLKTCLSMPIYIPR
eukprot:6889394-Ditylum_brightwellii.AAC.1